MGNRAVTYSTQRLLTLYLHIWLYQFIGIAIFAVGRIAFLLTHCSLDTLADHCRSLPLFTWNAWRFDIQATTYITLIPLIAAFITAFIKNENAVKRCIKFTRYYYAILWSIVALIVVAEFYFYDNFNCRYNVVFFDFFDEGPLGLLRTMWEDYPFMSILAFTVSVGSMIFLLGRYIGRKSIAPHCWMGTKATIASLAAIAAITFVFMRGSVTRYTLQVEAFIVSTDNNINNAVPNAIYLLKKAYKERKESFELKSDEAIIKESGFASFEELATASALPYCKNEQGTKAEDLLFAEAGPLQSKQPDILLIMNESWSSYLVDFDKGDTLDLQCSLRRHLDEDIVLKNFQSVRNGTVYTLESVILAMPYLHFFQSRFRYDSLATSIAYPLKQSGYTTRFITGIDPTWENLNEALKVQYFDSVDGRMQIMEEIQGSTSSQIGVYDEFLYRYIAQELKKGHDDGKPQFIMALTSTNHPPFTFPKNVDLPPLNEHWYDTPSIKESHDVKTKYGIGAQYANKSLGDFLNWFKDSEFADNTVIIVTGDHNVRSILDYSIVPERYKYSVPLYIYLPPHMAIDNRYKEMIEERFGCHYDILPTIAGIAFKQGTRYLNIGNNLLDTLKGNDVYYSYNEKQTLSPDTLHNDSISRQVEARQTLLKLYYQSIFRESVNQ